ncbi:MAG: PAS domain S-box protein, partial [Rhodospirillaceae bacterium]|nr:PAS domain S-box protein [Rhodospirillaceae bacterium]
IKNRKKDGGNYWVKATIVPFLNEKGRPFQYVAVRTDITERKEAEEEISQLKLALDEHAIVSIADIKGNITQVNDKFCDISGFSREELIGQNHRILKSGDHTLEFYEDLWQTISSGKPWHGEIKNRKKDGGNYWVKATIVPFLNEKGRPFQYVAVRTDITERKEVEEEISQFKTTLDRTHDCIFMFRPDTLRFFYVNQGGMDQVGYTEDELFGMRPFDIKPDFDEQGFREIVQPLIEGPQQSVTFETVHQHRNGDLIPVEIFLQYIAPPDEEARFVAIVRDVSERKIVEKAKSEFVSTVSHELRTPLTSIKGALGLIRAGAIGDLPDKLKSMLDIAYNNSERLVLLINDILDMEKIQSGEMHFNMKPMDATALAKSAIEANQGYGAQHGVTFVLTGMDEEAFVHGDVDRLMQVMSNLMSNAVKFSPAQGSVEISVTRKGDIIRVTVSDKGPGIPENFRRRIFSRFSQADSSDTRQKSGTGLGLSISKAIIEDHGGTIGFDSVEGKGTTFFFELPELKELTETRIAQPVRNDGEKHRILICEDEADIAVILAAMLQSAGYRTSVAGSAAEAKKLLDENQYDAMTLDLDLPDQDGIGLIRELRDNPKTQNLPIIVVSAAAREGEKEINGDAIGVIDWIEKPIEPTDLIDRLNHALTRHSNEKPRVLHVEDDEDILKVVAALVADAATIVMAETIAQAKTLLQNETFDLVILDLLLPDGAGEDLLPLLNKTGHGSTPVIVFSVKEMSADVAKNVHAILVKSQTSNDDLLNTIRSAIQATQSVE